MGDILQFPRIAASEPDTRSMYEVCRELVLGLIRAVRDDPAEMKARIMIAWEHGHFTAEEAESWIVLNGLQEY